MCLLTLLFLADVRVKMMLYLLFYGTFDASAEACVACLGCAYCTTVYSSAAFARTREFVNWLTRTTTRGVQGVLWYECMESEALRCHMLLPLALSLFLHLANCDYSSTAHALPTPRWPLKTFSPVYAMDMISRTMNIIIEDGAWNIDMS